MKQLLVIQIEKTVLKLADISVKGKIVFIHRMRRFVLPPSIENGECLKDPEAFADFVASSIEKGRLDRKKAILIMGTANVIQKEYRHEETKNSHLMSLALLEAEAVLPENEGPFIIENMPYGACKDKDGQIRSAIFAAKEEEVLKLAHEMKARGIPLVGIEAEIVAHSVFSRRFLNLSGPETDRFQKTVLVINVSSQDTLISVFNKGNLLHQRVEDFRIGRLFESMAEPFGVDPDDAESYFSKLGFDENCPEYQERPELFAQMEDSAAAVVTKLSRSLNVILSADDLEMDQILLCGEYADIPKLSELIEDVTGVPCVRITEYPDRIDQLLRLDGELKGRPDLIGPLLILAGGERNRRKNLNFLAKGLTATKKKRRTFLICASLFLSMVIVMSILPLSYYITYVDKQRNEALLASAEYQDIKALISTQRELQAKVAAVDEERDRLPFGNSEAAKYLTVLQKRLFTGSEVNSIIYNEAEKTFTVILSISDLDTFVAAKNSVNAQKDLKVSLPLTLKEENGRWVCQLSIQILDEKGTVQ